MKNFKFQISNFGIRTRRLAPLETGRASRPQFSMGFTLVELLVAISILSISILATFTAVSSNVKGQNFSEDQVIAYYLADEGIESIRNIRDNNGIANAAALGSGAAQISWLNGINPTCVTTACTADASVQPVALTACSSLSPSSCPVLSIKASGLYGYGSGTATQFKRSVVVSAVGGSLATEATVTCTVSWTTNGVAKTYTVSENMKAWQ